ncbi:MAG: cadherin domain-containing protein [Bacteroidota bacterium]
MKRIALLIGLLATVFFAKGQSPDWEVDLSQFAFRMTVSAVLEHNSKLLEADGNKVALFVGDEVRGVGATDIFHEPSGKYLAIFQVASDVASGETMNIRFYLAEEDEILNARATMEFAANELIGSVNEPIIISDNRFPLAIEVDVTNFSENMASGEVVSNLSTSDPDDDVHSYVIDQVDPEEAVDYLKVSGNQLVIDAPANFETVDRFEIVISSTDPLNGTVSRSISFQVNDENDQPTDISLSDVTVNENSPVGTRVGELTSTDEDSGDEFTYEIIPDEESLDYTCFTIIGNSLFTDKLIDRETTAEYTLEVTATDQAGASVSKTINVFVGDVNEPPVVNDTTFLVTENTVEPVVGTINASDPDEGQSLLFEFVGASEDFPFQVDENTGVVSLNGTVNFELQNNYQVVVKVVDSGLPAITELIELQIVISDINEPPTDILLTNQVIDENAGANALIGVLETVDEDGAELFEYRIVSVNGNSSQDYFSLINEKIFTTRSFNYELLNDFNIVISSADIAGLTVEKNFQISVNDLNEAPVLIDTVFSINEHSPVNARVGQLDFFDEDFDEEFTFQFVNSENLPFGIDATTSEIRVVNSDMLDYEENPVWNLEVVVTDGGSPSLRDTASVRINIEDIPENSFLPYNNYISPNGDQVNDFFEIENVRIYEGFLLKIFTPQGNVVYESDSYDNSWDGRWNGRLLPAGTYYFTFESLTQNIRYSGKIFLKDR